MTRTIIATILLLVLVESALAIPIQPVSYDMLNGGTGSWQYWDESYNGKGDKTKAYAPLSGGLGDLTDGIIADESWPVAERPAGPGPYVGWGINPTITFRFASVVNLSSLTLFLDGYNGLYMPGSVTLGMGGVTSKYSVVAPSSSAPLPISFNELGLVGDTLKLTINRKNNSGCIFLSEVMFDDGTILASNSTLGNPVPEPGTIFLFGAGLIGLVGYNWRRKRNN